MMEPEPFYSEKEVRFSYKLLKYLNKMLDREFVVIGGWAVYNYVGLQKSKDVDIVVDRNVYGYLSGQFAFKPIENTKIFRATVDGSNLDIFVDGFVNDLPITTREIIENRSNGKYGNFYCNKNHLIVLKTDEYLRHDLVNEKKTKDMIDVVSLLFFANIDFEYLRHYNNYKFLTFEDLKHVWLHRLLPQCFRYSRYLGLSENEYYKYWRKVENILKEI